MGLHFLEQLGQHWLEGVYYSNDTSRTIVHNEECCGSRVETDPTGIVTTYVYDKLGRLGSMTKEGVSAQTEDLVTAYSYDAAGRQLTMTVSDAYLADITLSSSNTYDMAGRMLTSTDNQGLTTTYDYGDLTSTGRTVTVKHPGMASDEPTVITQYNRDGTTTSVTGTAVIAQYEL